MSNDMGFCFLKQNYKKRFTIVFSVFVFVSVLALTVIGAILLLRPNVQDYKNISYEIDGETVTLLNGRSKKTDVPGSASEIITEYYGDETRADFNGDGTEDIAFIVTQDTGGSGTFYYLIGALKISNTYKGTNAVFLGDRIAPQSIVFNDGKLKVFYLNRKEGESFTTMPSVRTLKYFKIENGRLME